MLDEDIGDEDSEVAEVVDEDDDVVLMKSDIDQIFGLVTGGVALAEFLLGLNELASHDDCPELGVLEKGSPQSKLRESP